MTPTQLDQLIQSVQTQKAEQEAFRMKVHNQIGDLERMHSLLQSVNTAVENNLSRLQEFSIQY